MKKQASLFVQIAFGLGMCIVLLASRFHLTKSLGDGTGFDFTISATPASRSVCVNGGSANYTVSIGQIGNFSDPVFLSSSGTPPGTTTSFDVNPVTPDTPPATSAMTIDNIAGDIAGTYQIEITGISFTSSHTTTVQLLVFGASPSIPTLLSPPNAADDVQLSPNLSWSSLSEAEFYRLEVATNSNFTDIVYSADNLVATSHMLPVALESLTTYYWRVRGSNVCGIGNYAAPFSFETAVAPVYIPLVIK